MATTLFRGPVLQGKWNRAGVTGYNLEEKPSSYGVQTTDLGKSFTSKSGDITFTLHSHGAGYTYTFTNTGTDGTNEVKVTAAGAGEMSFAGSTGITLTNTKATSKVGDYVTLHSIGAVWALVGIQGTWALS